MHREGEDGKRSAAKVMQHLANKAVVVLSGAGFTALGTDGGLDVFSRQSCSKFLAGF